MTASLATAAAARDDALERVEAAADAAWFDMAWKALVAYLRRHEQFFVDDFWSETELPVPREARALGPLVRRAVRAGYLKKTGGYRPSVRSHMTAKPIWRSTLCPG